MTQSLQNGRTITQHLSSLKNSCLVKISNIDAAGQVFHPVTSKTLVRTSTNTLEAGVDYIGWGASAKIGEFPAFFYKSNPTYHSRWFKYWHSGSFERNTGSAFEALKRAGPCIGVRLALMLTCTTERLSASLIVSGNSWVLRPPLMAYPLGL